MDDLLNQTCTLYSGISTPDSYGKFTWAIVENVACRFIRTYKSTGFDKKITCKFQIADKEVLIGNQIEFEGKKYIVEAVKDWRDQDDYFGCLCYCYDS